MRKILVFLCFVHAEVEHRIAGGTAGNISSNKHMAAIFYKGSYKCAGVVLKNNYVLSAAHCDYRRSGDSASTIKVRGGMQTSASMVNVQEKSASALKKHPSYSTASQKNDIMLIKLSSAFNLNTYIQPASLPSAGASTSSYSICSWGYDSSNRDTKNLYCYSGRNVAHSTCNSSTGWKGLVYSPYQMCIEGTMSSQGACFHDGGAPAVASGKVYGLYSFPDLQSNGKTYPSNAKCNAAGKPGVFTQVNQYVSWINSNMT